MTLQQEAYSRIDQMTVYESQPEATMTKNEKKRCFIQSAGKINVDANAVSELREESMI